MGRFGRTLVGAIAIVMIGCTDASEPPLVEYPPLEGETGNEPSDDRAHGPANNPPSSPTPPTAEPIAGKKIASGSMFLRSATSDGALVFDQGLDLMVWPAGAAAPTRLVQDFTVGEDSLQVRGRIVAAWLGEDIGASSPTVWANTGGTQTIAPKIHREGIYPKPAADDFAYLTPSTNSLRRDVWATKAGGGAGAKIVSGLDTGQIESQCRPTITYSASDLIIAGCTNAATTPKVTAYALDGSSTTKTILDASAPGIFLNRARTHALVQTSTASSIRPLSGLGAPVVLDGPIRQAFFSSDDAKVVYLTGDKKVKRASTKAPSSPVEILGAAISVLAVSPDARFIVVATKGDLSKGRTDIVVLDANAPTTTPPRTLVPQEGALLGLSKDGTSIVYLGDAGTSYNEPLFIASLGSANAAPPQKLADDSSGALYVDDVVYWQEFQSASKTNVLKATRTASPATIVTIESSLDPMTQQMVIGKTLFVANKLGLWSYPAITP